MDNDQSNPKSQEKKRARQQLAMETGQKNVETPSIERHLLDVNGDRLDGAPQDAGRDETNLDNTLEIVGNRPNQEDPGIEEMVTAINGEEGNLNGPGRTGNNANIQLGTAPEGLPPDGETPQAEIPDMRNDATDVETPQAEIPDMRNDATDGDARVDPSFQLSRNAKDEAQADLEFFGANREYGEKPGTEQNRQEFAADMAVDPVRVRKNESGQTGENGAANGTVNKKNDGVIQLPARGNREAGNPTIQAQYNENNPRTTGGNRGTRVQANGGGAAAAEDGKTLGWFGLVLAIISWFVWPAILGPAAAVIGFIAWSRGSKALGVWSIVLGLIAFTAFLFLAPL